MFLENAVRLLRSCRELEQGRRIHRHLAAVVATGHVLLGNLIVEMYGRCGSPDEARRAFDAVARRNSFSWGILMSGYARNGHMRECEEVFDWMPLRDVVTWNAMITAYAQFGLIARSQSLFLAMPERNLVSWNAIVAAFAQNGHFDEAQEVFHKMPCSDIVSWNTIAPHLSSDRSREFFDCMPERNEISWSSTIQSIAQAGDSPTAGALLDRMPQWCVVACNALIAATETSIEQAQELFDQMPHRDVATWTAMMDAYGRAGLPCRTRRIFAEMPVRNIFSWTVLIVAVARCAIDGDGSGQIEESRSIFSRMPATNLVAWNATIAAFAEYPRHLSEAWNLFVSSPIRDSSTWSSLVRGFGQSGATARAEEILSKMPQHGLVAWNSMLVAFAQSGHFEKAYSLFRAMPTRDRFSWSAALSWDRQRFWEMILEGIDPDPVCATSLLASLKDAGDLQSVRDWFIRLFPDFGIDPAKDHFYCIADALARSGESILALEFLENIPFDPDAVAWTAILSSCVESSDARLGAFAAERVLYGDGRDHRGLRNNNGQASAYISLSNTLSFNDVNSLGC